MSRDGDGDDGASEFSKFLFLFLKEHNAQIEIQPFNNLINPFSLIKRSHEFENDISLYRKTRMRRDTLLKKH